MCWVFEGPVDIFRDRCSQSQAVEEKHPHLEVSPFLSRLGDANEGMPCFYIKIISQKRQIKKISLLKRPGALKTRGYYLGPRPTRRWLGLLTLVDRR